MDSKSKQEILNAIEHALMNDEISVDTYERVARAVINGDNGDVVTINVDESERFVIVLP